MKNAGGTIVDPDVVLDREFGGNILLWPTVAIDDLVDPTAKQIIMQLQPVHPRAPDRDDIDDVTVRDGVADEGIPKSRRGGVSPVEVECDTKGHARVSHVTHSALSAAFSCGSSFTAHCAVIPYLALTKKRACDGRA